jgi:8-oxo-dGTP diphosphatase
LARFVAFHELPERDASQLPTPSFAVMIARSRDGVVLVFSRFRKVWELPGGLIDPGESPRQSAERELAEEAACVASGSEWLGIVEVNDGRAHFGGVFRCAVDQVPAHFENAETGGIALWRRDKAPEPMGHSDAALLERFG